MILPLINQKHHNIVMYCITANKYNESVGMERQSNTPLTKTDESRGQRSSVRIKSISSGSNTVYIWLIKSCQV